MNHSKRSDRTNDSRGRPIDVRALSHWILEYANQGVLRTDFQREVSKVIINFSGCDAVELWLRDHGKYFRTEVRRQSKKPLLFKTEPIDRNEKGELTPGPEDDPYLFRLCTALLARPAHSSGLMPTRKRSSWAGDARKSVSIDLRQPGRSHPESLCKKNIYPSFLIIPLFVNQQNIGLLQLRSKLRNYFKKTDVKRCEDFSRSLEIAIANRESQLNLRERVKELTCLFGIARLGAHPGISLEEVLTGILELLPPAWLYPNITFAKTLLDGHSYLTPGFQEGRQKQTADIIIGGRRRGVIEVVYTEERPELDEGPFLKEERTLIDMVAREVASIIERREAGDYQLKLQEQLIRSEKMAALGQLSAGIAHEIRTPLTSIKIFIQSLEKEIDLDENKKEDFRIIKKEIDRINENVTLFLNFARPEDPIFQRANVNALVMDALNLLTAKIKTSGIHLKISLLEDPPPLEGDTKQLSQVFLNLILNAIEAMPKGGTLTIRSMLKAIPESQEIILQLVFQDTGGGIPEKDRPYLFDPFFTTKDTGTGLGLSIVYSIVQKHNGQIEVESELAKGSSFILSLPVHKEGTWKELSSSMTT
ncbi:MAG: ATP-binding protein [Thermodesulfobacteriota bacterium]|nr:ATP-binding protein [Thermodesulfobacteriota bacterium]